ncbi:MAG: nicotinamide mononucleotide transporter family protein [Comamonas sp.]|nr:nicotinamide mononucleotide transporter family protein [Comamonas sp.]
MQLIEIFSAILGMAGALLLATRNRHAGWAFVVWLISNVGWIAFGAGNQHWFFLLQQVVFTATSVIGIWQWLIHPRLQAKRLVAKVPPSPGMTVLRAHEVLCLVSFPGYQFRVVGNFSGATYLQAVFHAPCNVSGGKPVRQSTRKWRLSAHMTPSELVQTALKCVLTSLEHEAREQFHYRGRAIFGPHFDVERLVALCDRGTQAMEVRA